MKRSSKVSITTAAAFALTAATAKAQTLVYSFETLYDSSNVPDPAGTMPDDFSRNPNNALTSVTQSTVGVTDGNFSMEISQMPVDTYTGAITQLVPAAIDATTTVALSADITIPASLAYKGAFARMGILEFGSNPSVNDGTVTQDAIDLNNEINVDLPAGTYHLTIPLIGEDPVTFNDDGFYNAFGTGSGQLTPTSFEFYINKIGGNSTSGDAFNLYMDNVTAIGPSVNGTWAGSGGGSWATTGSWNGGVPQTALDTANLNNSITANSTIDLNGNRSMQALNISSTAQYTIAQGSGGTLTLDAGGSNVSTITVSSGTHTISAPVDFNTNTTITVNNAGNTLNLSGPVSGIGGLTIAGNGTVGISGTASYIGGTTITMGTLLVGSATSLPTSNSVVNIAAGAEMKFATGIGGVTVQMPNITPGGILDIGNNHLIIDYAPTSDPITAVEQLLQSGYNGGAWNGVGIDTTAPLVVGGLTYGLGYADAADAQDLATGLASGTVEIKYTLLGDADLNGIVNGIDFGILAANFNKGITGWDEGDFDYNNIVNGLDFGDLAANFNKGAAGTAATDALDAFAAANGLLADVPEPASLGVLAVATVATLARRRRRVV